MIVYLKLAMVYARASPKYVQLDMLPEWRVSENKDALLPDHTFASSPYRRLFATCPKLRLLHANPHALDDHVAFELREECKHLRESLAPWG
jgi:hypothetical protein